MKTDHFLSKYQFLKISFSLVSSFFLLWSCQNANRNNTSEELAVLVGQPFYEVFFSYPGRFSPNHEKQKVKQEILSLIRSAQANIRIWFYSFNDLEILEELQKAKTRGVQLEFVLDSEYEYPPEIFELGTSSLWRGGGLQHIKLLLIDDSIVFLGTGNFTDHGLERDYNGYWKFSLPKEKKSAFLEFLYEKQKGFFPLEENSILLNSPSEGILLQSIILQRIFHSRKRIQVLLFEHTDPVLSIALELAKVRGVEVEIVYDRPIPEEGEYLSARGIAVREDGNEDRIQEGRFPIGGLLHHKTLIFDGEFVGTGSYNLTRGARDKNREIFFLTKDPIFVSEFQKEFQRIWEKSSPKSSQQAFARSYLLLGNSCWASLGIFENRKLDSISSGLFSFEETGILKGDLPQIPEQIQFFEIPWKQISSMENRIPNNLRNVFVWDSLNGFRKISKTQLQTHLENLKQNYTRDQLIYLETQEAASLYSLESVQTRLLFQFLKNSCAIGSKFP